MRCASISTWRPRWMSSLNAEGIRALTDLVTTSALSADVIADRARQIHADVLSHSRYITESDFRRINTGDLAFLFDAYDGRFFGGLCRQALGDRALSFRLSSRMTKAGGVTSRFRSAAGVVSYQISIGSSMLFDGIGKAERQVTVCGLDCANRLEALQRIFEHEMVHLVEQLCWERSNCAAERFQDIARRLFLHRAHTHELVTRRERAVASGIRPGGTVTFVFEGRRL